MALTDNQVAYWKLDESSGNAADATGNGKTLTNTNSVSYGTGKINNGADFGTTSTNKVLTIAENLGITTGSISISCWVKMNAEIVSGNQVFIRHQNNTNDVAYSIRYEVISSTKYVGFYRTKLGVADQAVYNAVALGTSNWYHLVLTYNGTNIVGYINGSALTPVAASGDGNGGTFTDDVNIGLWSGTTFPCKAIIDEVGIWSRAVTADEVTALYNSGNGKQYPYANVYTLTAAYGSYVLTGINNSIRKNLRIVASAGEFVLTGINALLSRGRGVTFGAMNFVLTSGETALRKTINLLASAGTYVLTGIDATLNKTTGFVSGALSYILSLGNIRIGGGGNWLWSFDTKQSSSWSNDTKVESTYTNDTKPTSTWTNDDK